MFSKKIPIKISGVVDMFGKGPNSSCAFLEDFFLRRVSSKTYLDVPLEVSEGLGSVGYNPNIPHL